MDQKFQYVQIRTRQFTDNTCPDLEVPRRARKKPDDEADALAVQRPVLLRPTGPTLPWQAWLSISIHKEPALLCVSCSISARAFSNSSLQHKPQDAKQSQETNVATRNSSLCWQFAEIRAQEPAVPLTVNRGPAAIYHSGLTGIRSSRAVRCPLRLP